MSYSVFILPRAVRELAGLPTESSRKITKAVSDLTLEPRPPGCRKLRGRDGWRIRVGDYRVVYEIQDASKRVIILHVGHRRDIYR